MTYFETVKGSGRKVMIEDEHEVVRLLKYLPAGPTEDGQGFREQTLVQFVAKHGGVRTVRASDLVDVR